ncbi:hypothetical protein GCM10007052_13320 [Halioglobus japonicus]|nr:hypothetical protein GCM10007052_13320 [Halioglobus japonicus]
MINTGNINIGNSVNVGNRTIIGNKIKRNEVTVNRDGMRRDNLYTRKENCNRLADPGVAQRDAKKALSNKNMGNNVYADRDGKISRNVNNKWESLDKGQWKADKELNKKPTQPVQRDYSKVGQRDHQKPTTQDRSHNASRDMHKPTTQDVHRPTTNQPHKRPSNMNRQRDLERARQARAHGSRMEANRPVQRREFQRRR